MKKIKTLIIFLTMILLISGCSSNSAKTENSSETEIIRTVVDEKLDKDKILFLRCEYAYYKEVDKYYVVISSVDNSGKYNVMSIELNSDASMIKNIEDPNALLLFTEKTDKEDIYTLNILEIDTLYEKYNQTFNIENKTEFIYNVAYGDYNPDYKSVLYGYTYIDESNYVPTKYFYSNTVSAELKDENAKPVLDYLYANFQ